MDIREFSDKIAQATKNMSEDERQSLMKMFETVSDEIASVPKASAQASAGQNSGDIQSACSNKNYQRKSGNAKNCFARKML